MSTTDCLERLVRFDGDEMTVRFGEFDLAEYEAFLKVKRLPEYTIRFDDGDESYTVAAPARFAAMLGVDRPIDEWAEKPLSPFLFDDQKAIVRLALDAKRFACWSDTGLGKTLIELEFATQVQHRTNGRVLLVTLANIVPQMHAMARQFYPDVELPIIGSQKELITWCGSGKPGLALTNYEKFNPKRLPDGVINECRHLSAIVLDESSRLKGGGDSQQKKVLIRSCKGIEYKLSCTATPAPNQVLEFVSQATFLEKVRTDLDIIWSYFVRDSKTHRRSVRPHARGAFFDFMASWSVYLKHPKRFGWRLNQPEVPEPVMLTHEIDITPEQRKESLRLLDGTTGSLFVARDTNTIERSKLAQLARGFIYRKGRTVSSRTVQRVESRKPPFVADLIRSEVADGHQVLVWAVFDEESKILAGLLDGAEFRFDSLTGNTPKGERQAILGRFLSGESRCLIARPKMLGFGYNFQCCSSMVFSGFNESFEDLYQSIRRAYRFGQTQAVRVHFPIIEELEGDMFANLKRKSLEHEQATCEMEDNYLRSFAAVTGKDVI